MQINFTPLKGIILASTLVTGTAALGAAPVAMPAAMAHPGAISVDDPCQRADGGYDRNCRAESELGDNDEIESEREEILSENGIPDGDDDLEDRARDALEAAGNLTGLLD